ncbi:VHS domain-containing protein [Chloropicon primus]|uniref:VHS domain-containing protein n=1 Tax=Chloropicon primus TaxID=1764295 RepID=A0A5B8MBS8_9CHLO|nr:hypothetical protein A3770_01p03410 [Chloropicon primus]UPQ97039.1 VHS domain-containing protein [Chloropicon primus]|mmetsp:Transcript_1785/g.4882  ORF Transcript_1785/g.4882 Transcript_1785/m.4882 type:complete len:516 (-) Transcript_1785:147-1694(-)|eukprot:QDZ17823.1 hypothetical protein A3770_01p03410 [Chloropicon primus]
MERLRSYFGYKTISDANVMAKGGGDLKTDENAYVREMVNRATNDLLMTSDWALNMEVVDFVNRGDAKMKESVARALSNRLDYGDSHVTSLTLTLTDTCVKNCGSDFQGYLDRPTCFAETLIRLVTSNDTAGCSEELKNQILTLILDWKNVAPCFEEAFNTLKFKHNVSFPRAETKCVPISTPPARYATKEEKEEEANRAEIARILRAQETVESESRYSEQPLANQGHYVVVNQQGSHPSSQLQTNVIYNMANSDRVAYRHPYPTATRSEEEAESASVPTDEDVKGKVDTLWNSCALLKEILEAVDANCRDAIDAALSDELVVSIMESCKEGQKEIKTRWINHLSDEAVLHRALTLNDEIDFCTMLHDSLVTARSKPPCKNIAAGGGLEGGQDLYTSIFSPNQAIGGGAATSNVGRPGKGLVDSVALTQSYPAEMDDGAVELKDNVFSCSSSSISTETQQRTSGYDQPDLISFDAEPATELAKDPAKVNVVEEQTTAEARADANAQASRIEDLLSL